MFFAVTLENRSFSRVDERNSDFYISRDVFFSRKV